MGAKYLANVHSIQGRCNNIASASAQFRKPCQQQSREIVSSLDALLQGLHFRASVLRGGPHVGVVGGQQGGPLLQLRLEAVAGARR